MEIATFTKLFSGTIAVVLSQLLAAAQPFYARRDLRSEPGLAGTYAAPRPASDSGTPSVREGVLIAREAGGYQVVFKDGRAWGEEASAAYTGRLFSLGVGDDDQPNYFLDLAPVRGTARPAPAGASHLALAVRWDDATLRLGSIDPAWLSKQLASGLLPHREVVLTASTGQLRRVLLLAAAQGAVGWSDPLYRQPDAVSARRTP